MLLDSTAWRVATAFFRAPTKEFTMADLKRETKLTYPGLKPHLDMLAKQKIVYWTQHQKTKRPYKLYKANREASEYKYWKRLHNILSLKSVVEHLQKIAPDVVILFGSYARGEDGEESDIDLYVQTVQQDLKLHPFELELGKPINCIIQPYLGNLPNSLQQNLRSGVVLLGTFTALTREQIEPDTHLAAHMREQATKEIDTFKALNTKEMPNLALKYQYDALRSYGEAHARERGVRFRGDGAHYDLFQYLREVRAITEDERIFLQDFREMRNRNMYDGAKVPEEYLDRRAMPLRELLEKLRNLTP
jgi:hypothetical protein